MCCVVNDMHNASLFLYSFILNFIYIYIYSAVCLLNCDFMSGMTKIDKQDYPGPGDQP